MGLHKQMNGYRVLFFASGKVGFETLLTAVQPPFDGAKICGILTCATDANIIDLAAEHQIPTRIFESAQSTMIIKDYAADVVFLAWWPHILRPEHLLLGQRFTLNMHPSLLPHGRGKDPNFWALVENKPFGVTIHHVLPGIDNGDIAFQREIATSWLDTGATLYDKATAEIVSLFRDNYGRIQRLEIPRIPQDHAIASYHTRAQLAPRSVIDLDATYTGRELLNLLRAKTFHPHPAASFLDGGKAYQVRVSIEDLT